jgi:hypothetical protein
LGVTDGYFRATETETRMILRHRIAEDGQDSTRFFFADGESLGCSGHRAVGSWSGRSLYIITVEVAQLTLIGQVTAMVVFLGMCSLCTAAARTGS